MAIRRETSEPMPPRYILTLSCTDRPGIVGAVGTFLAEQGCNIVESAQFGDADTQVFFMRVVFAPVAERVAQRDVEQAFEAVASRFAMRWAMHDANVRPRVLIMVSKLDHCLNDLLYRYRIGALPMEPVAVVSNHRDPYRLVASHDVPFHHLPVTATTKAAQEAKLWALIEETGAELVVLARYMQILSDDLAAKLAGRAINIHHGLLPSFKGARPYHQAYERGVKLIGATAHYVTADLDEGPIIEQDVARVDYSMRADDLVALGRDVERIALPRAVRYHLERRVFLDGVKTIVFR
jgi:formyltetrahydrofolate deformylase